MKKSRFLTLLMATTLTFSLAACGGGAKTNSSNAAEGTEGTNAGTNEKITLTFQSLRTDKTDPLYLIEEKIVNDYKAEHSNVTIEWDRLDIEQQKVKLKTQAASGEVADITMVNPGAQLKPFADGKVFAPLNDVVEGELGNTFLKGILDYYSFDGNLYALPVKNDIAGIFYNKELFEKANVQIPTTYEELIEVTKKIKAAGILPMAIAGKDRWPLSFMFMNVLQRVNGGPGFLQDVLDGKRDFNDPVFVKSIQKVQDLIKAGAYQEGATSYDYVTAANLFKNGKAAMLYMGTWELSAIDASPVKGKVGFMQFPTIEGKGNPDDFMLAPGTAYAIGANSKHLQETKDLLKYLMTKYPQVAFDMKAAVGLAQKVDGDMKAAGYSGLAIDTMEKFNKVHGGDLNFDNIIEPSTTQAHLTGLQNLFVRDIKAEDLAKEHQNAWEMNK